MRKSLLAVSPNIPNQGDGGLFQEISGVCSHSSGQKAPGSRRQDSNKKRTNTSHCFFHQEI